MAARDELVAAVADRYAWGDRGERGRILDEFAAVPGYHRKHAMRRHCQIKRRRARKVGGGVNGSHCRDCVAPLVGRFVSEDPQRGA